MIFATDLRQYVAVRRPFSCDNRQTLTSSAFASWVPALTYSRASLALLPPPQLYSAHKRTKTIYITCQSTDGKKPVQLIK